MAMALYPITHHSRMVTNGATTPLPWSSLAGFHPSSQQCQRMERNNTSDTNPFLGEPRYLPTRLPRPVRNAVDCISTILISTRAT